MAKHEEVKKYIKIRKASEHNLKGIDIDIPRDEFVVLTGLSGSGKSSLAFDTTKRSGGPFLVFCAIFAASGAKNGMK